MIYLVDSRYILAYKPQEIVRIRTLLIIFYKILIQFLTKKKFPPKTRREFLLTLKTTNMKLVEITGFINV